MSLESARGQLMSALEGADIRTYYGFQTFTGPCCRIFPGQPWVDLSGMAGGRRTQRWEVWAVGGKVDSGADYDEVEKLVQSINDALVGLKGWGFPAWQRPSITDMGGTKYLACRGIVETLMEV